MNALLAYHVILQLKPIQILTLQLNLVGNSNTVNTKNGTATVYCCRFRVSCLQVEGVLSLVHEEKVA